MYIKDKDGNYVPTPSSKGADGREVSLRVANNYIQWRYPDTEWTNLVPLSDLKGEPGTDGIDGREVHMRVVSDTLQWRLGDSGTWQTLMSLSTVTDGAAFGGMVVDKTLVLAEMEAGGGGGGTADAVTYTPQTLTTEQQKQARTNIGAGQPLFVVNVTTTLDEQGGEVYTADKTAAEIETAYQAGRTIVCRATGPLMGTYIPVELPLLSRLQERVFYFGAEQLSSQSSGKRLDRLNVQISDSGVNVSADVARIYEKSEYGIPKSDLAEDVQTSLDKADTAISYNSQTLTEEQKSQARTNIGAVDENLGCNKYNIHVTTTSGTTKDFTYYTNEGEIRQPTEAVDSSIRTAFLGLTLWPSAKGISENLAKTLSKQYKILYDANYIDSPCCIIKSPLESGDKVLLSYHSSDNTVHVSGGWTDGYYNIIYDVANDVLTYFYVENNISAVNGAVNQLVMSAAPTEDMHIATKQYVDTAKAEGQQLGLTAATPGQIIKVKAVQDGKPTEWEAVDMPGGEEWEKVADIELRADTALYVLADYAMWRKAKVIMRRSKYVSGLDKNVWCRVMKKGEAPHTSYSCGYLAAEYGYVYWDFSAEVSSNVISSATLRSNNTNSAEAVRSTQTLTPINLPPTAYELTLIFMDTSVIQDGDKVTVIGVRR